jgi:hypothetical protein
MIKDTLSEIISKDPSCLLGLIKFDTSKFLYSLAPVRYENIIGNVPIADIESKYSLNNPMRIFGEWSTEAGIFSCSGCQVQNSEYVDKPFNDYICSSEDDTNWKIDTNLNLNNILSNANEKSNDLTILSLLKVEPRDLINIDNCNKRIEFSYTYEIVVTNQNGEEIPSSKTEYEDELIEKINFNDFFDFNINENITGIEGSRDYERIKARNEAYFELLNTIKDDATIQLFKHSYEVDNKKFIIDIKFILFNQNNDADGEIEICGKLLFDVIYFDGIKTFGSSLNINLTDSSYNGSIISLARQLFDEKWHLLSFEIDCEQYVDENDDDNYTFVLSIFDNGEKINNKDSHIDVSFIDVIDTLVSEYGNDEKFTICGNGSKQIKMKNVFVFNRFINPYEIKFFELLLNFRTNDSDKIFIRY